MESFQPVIAAFYLVFGGVFLFLAYLIIRDNPGQRLNRTAGLMLFFAALGPIFLALGTIIKPNVDAGAPFEDSALYNLHYLWEFFFPAFLLFSLAYPIDRLSSIKRQRLRYLIFLPYAFHLMLVLFFKNPEWMLDLLEFESGEGLKSIILEPLSYALKWVILGFSLLLSSEQILFAIINVLYAIFAVGIMIRGTMLIANDQVRKQTIYFTGGIALAVLLYISAFSIPAVFAGNISNILQTLLMVAGLLIGGGTITLSVVRQQFLDVRLIIRQSLVYTVTSGILVGLYVLLIGLGGKAISAYFGGETTIINIAFIVAALILFQPINTRLDNLIKKLFIKGGSDYRHVLEEISRRLITTLDQEQLKRMIEDILRSSVLVERVFFVLYDDKLKEYALLPSEGFPNRVIIDRKDLFLGGVNQLNSPALMGMLTIYKEGSRLAAEIDKRRVEIILPLKDANHLLGFLAMTGKSTGFKYNPDDMAFLGVIANQLVTSLTNARLYADSLEKQRLDEEVSMARQIQLDLLPKNPPAGDNFTIATYSIPSRIIGGDFYDFIPIDSNGRFGMVIADASGKGMPAALMVAQIQATLRSEIGNSRDISRILFNVNKHVAASSSSEKYATLFYGEFDKHECVFRYANAGHNYPILVRADGSYEYLSEGGMIIGAFAGASFTCAEVILKENDLIFFYTDGVSEAMNDNDEEYGDQRIREFVVTHRNMDPEKIIQGILNDIRNFDRSDPPRDDTTVVVLKVCTGR